MTSDMLRIDGEKYIFWFVMRILYSKKVGFLNKSAFEIKDKSRYNDMESNRYRGRDDAMFRVNDMIIYGSQGVCKIAAIEEMSIGGEKRAYFVLRPIKDQSAAVYVPTDNEAVRKKMRRLLTVNEIHALIDSMPEEKILWIDNTNERKEHYKKLLAEGDHSALIRMIKAVYTHKKSREAAGKRLHMMDEYFFKEAEQMLYDEFQYVLNLPCKDALMKYILDRIGAD